jgi:colicin import membrane protein
MPASISKIFTGVPKCSDERTLDLVREIILDHQKNEKIAAAPKTFIANALAFEYPRASKFDSSISKYDCEVKLVVQGDQNLAFNLEYTTQLDDSSQQLVSVSNLTEADINAIASQLETSLQASTQSNSEVTAPSNKQAQEPAEQPQSVVEALDVDQNLGGTNQPDDAVEEPVPPYGSFMQACVDGEEAQRPDGVFGSTVERAMSEALCQCQFEHFPISGFMSKTKFISSALDCKREQEQDLLSFTKKYLANVQRSDTVPGAENANEGDSANSDQGLARAGSPTEHSAPLTERYASALNDAIARNWIRPSNIDTGEKCGVSIVQVPGGEVIRTAFAPSCEFDELGRRSLEAAIYKASPLPYAGFEQVFTRSANINFIAE